MQPTHSYINRFHFVNPTSVGLIPSHTFATCILTMLHTGVLSSVKVQEHLLFGDNIRLEPVLQKKDIRESL